MKTWSTRTSTWTLIIIVAALLLTACGPRVSVTEETPFNPPTRDVSLTPLVLISPTPPRPTPKPTIPPTPDCDDYLSYLADLTIPDGTEVSPGQLIDKRWEVRNSGTCNWEEGYQVRLVEGPEMGAPAEQALYPARPETDVVLRMQFTAPEQPGTYRSAWRAYNAKGEAFGETFYVEVVVQSP